MAANITLDQVKAKLKAKWKNRYQFPNIDSEYVNCLSRITVVCELHGEFYPILNSILNIGSGCRKCGRMLVADRLRLSPNQIREKIFTIHGDKYIFPYVESEYDDIHSSLTGICKAHGKFTVIFSNMINYQCGCSTCGNINKRNVPINNGLADYERYHNQVLITDGPICGPHGELQVRCKMCRRLMTPTLVQVITRFHSINRMAKGESNFYCSDKCKSECTTYNKKYDNHLNNNIPDYDAKVKLARNCQLETKTILRQQQFDKHGYHFCEKCGKHIDNPELHHTIEVAKDPSGAITISGQMLVCSDPCHKEFTRMCR